jgi:o-succinylbenzoate synthase
MKKYHATFEKKTYVFKQPSGTSRGVLTEKHAWFIYLTTTNRTDRVGVGECSIIPGLSPDFNDFSEYECKIQEVCKSINYYIENQNELENYPSIFFGLETALLDLNSDLKGVFFDTYFTRKVRGIPINGLIWMGTKDNMLQQIEEKLLQGFTCLKMKVGAIDFNQELDILKGIRKRFSSSEIELRVDANGAFAVKDALVKLDKLSKFQLHSIEQPIKQGQIQEMADLCSKTPLPIALDEELIGVYGMENKKRLLSQIKPQFIILKPSLHGGLKGSSEWINIAEKKNIPWWMTSALESNIGLNIIAQFSSIFNNLLPQGLGTGGLYVQNETSEMRVENGLLYFEGLYK